MEKENENSKLKIIILVLIVIIVILTVVVFTGNKKNTKTSSPVAKESIITDEKDETVEEKEENETGQGIQAKEVKMGETIKNDYLKMKIDKFEIKTEYKFSYTERKSGFTTTHNNSIDGKNGMKLVCLKGKLTNLTKHKTTGNFVKGEMIINGNTYETTLECFDTKHAERNIEVFAQQETDYFLYAKVPNNVANNIKTCIINFGCAKNLSYDENYGTTININNMKDLEVSYTLKAK